MIGLVSTMKEEVQRNREKWKLVGRSKKMKEKLMGKTLFLSNRSCSGAIKSNNLEQKCTVCTQVQSSLKISTSLLLVPICGSGSVPVKQHLLNQLNDILSVVLSSVARLESSARWSNIGLSHIAEDKPISTHNTNANLVGTAFKAHHIYGFWVLSLFNLHVFRGLSNSLI